MPHHEHPLPNRRSVRLRGHDYRKSGVYFVTLCTYRQSSIFGAVCGGQMHLNALGKIVQEYWRQIAGKRPNVELDTSVVMPNHLHGIVIVGDEDDDVTPSHDTIAQMNAKLTLTPGSLGAIIGQFKRAVTIRSKSLALHPAHPIWQRNYYEHIVRSEESLNAIRDYIFHNPARWSDDQLFNE